MLKEYFVIGCVNKETVISLTEFKTETILDGFLGLDLNKDSFTVTETSSLKDCCKYTDLESAKKALESYVAFVRSLPYNSTKEIYEQNMLNKNWKICRISISEA